MQYSVSKNEKATAMLYEDQAAFNESWVCSQFQNHWDDCKQLQIAVEQ
jgi:hypothetical protein